MTHPPEISEWSPAHSSDGPGGPAATILVAAASPMPNDHENSLPSDSVHVDQSGRPLGPRALRTRTRILEATVSLLDEKSMRDLRVIDIARRIGSSPATFYQYFKDVNDVVLELAVEASSLTPDMTELIRGDWTGKAGLERGRRLVNLVMDYWDRYKAILRVRNNASDEGDPAFGRAREKALRPVVLALVEVIRASQRESGAEDVESTSGQIHPFSAAMLLFSTLESMAINHDRFEKYFEPLGEGREALVETIATVLQSTLTANSPKR